MCVRPIGFRIVKTLRVNLPIVARSKHASSASRRYEKRDRNSIMISEARERRNAVGDKDVDDGRCRIQMSWPLHSDRLSKICLTKLTEVDGTK